MNTDAKEWSGSLCPLDPANYWVDDETGERVNAATGERTEYTPEQWEAIDKLDAEEEFDPQKFTIGDPQA